jgi:hypothetical protein
VNVTQVRGKWFLVLASGKRLGPYTHAEAVEIRDTALSQFVKPAGLTDAHLAAILKEAIEHPPRAPRGRPQPERPVDVEIAIEYHWRKRQGGRSARVVREVAKKFACTPDFVRKCRAKYDALPDYDDELLNALHAQPLKREAGPEPVDPEEYLRMLLARGPLAVREVYRRGKMAGFTEDNLDRAKRALDVVSTRTGNGWNWSLPDSKGAKSGI